MSSRRLKSASRPVVERAAVYTRISADPHGTETATQRQREDCVARAEAEGLEIVDFFRDPDLSAFKRGVRRPEFERLLEQIQAGAIDVVLVWRLDRLLRQPRDLERFVDVCEPHGVELVSMTEPVTMLSGTGMLITRMLAGFAAHESQIKSERLKRKAIELAKAGRNSGGGSRPFGFHCCPKGSSCPDDRIAHEPAEADLIREAAERILDGETLRGVLADWDRRGVRGPTGKKLPPGTLKRILISPRVVGERNHPEVGPVRAVWPAILDKTTHERLRVILLDPARARWSGHHAGRYLLTGGIAVCGCCGTPLVARPKAGRSCCASCGSTAVRCPTCGRADLFTIQRSRIRCNECLSVGDGRCVDCGVAGPVSTKTPQPAIVCARGPGFKGCGRIRRLAGPLDAFVRDVIAERLRTVRFDDVLRARRDQTDAAALAGELMLVEEAAETLAADHYVSGLITRPEFLAARGPLQTRAEGLRTRLAAYEAAHALISIPRGSEAFLAKWEQADVEWRRSIVRSLVERIEVHPAIRGKTAFDPDRIQIFWRV